MNEEPAAANLLDLTAEIVTAHVANNSVHASDLPKMIATVHAALASLGASETPAPAEPEHKPAVSVRKSLASDEHLISMIDGKSYKTLRRHLRTHGMTDKDYRARFNLPADYPMVAKAYSATRSAMARTLGLGRQAGQKVKQAAAAVEETVADAAAPAVKKAKRTAKQAVTAVEDVAKPARRKRKVAQE